MNFSKICPKYGPLSDRNDDSKRDPESIGECIIFNHQIYEPSTGFSEREGTELDAQELKKAFLTMGFGVSQYDNRSVSQIFEILSNGMSITLIISLVHIVMHTMLHTLVVAHHLIDT